MYIIRYLDPPCETGKGAIRSAWISSSGPEARVWGNRLILVLSLLWMHTWCFGVWILLILSNCNSISHTMGQSSNSCLIEIPKCCMPEIDINGFGRDCNDCRWNWSCDWVLPWSVDIVWGWECYCDDWSWSIGTVEGWEFWETWNVACVSGTRVWRFRKLWKAVDSDIIRYMPSTKGALSSIRFWILMMQARFSITR